MHSAGLRAALSGGVLLVAVLIFATGCSSSSGPGESGPVTIDFEAVVATVIMAVDNPSDSLYVAVGDTIAGSYTYDPEAEDEDADERIGMYHFDVPPYGFSVEIGGVLIETAPGTDAFRISITDGHSGQDVFSLYSPVGCWFNFCNTASIAWELTDPDSLAVSSTELTSDPPVLEAWQQTFGLTFEMRDTMMSDQEIFVRAEVFSVVRR